MKKKLLFINGHLNTGGVEKSLLDVLCHMDYAQYEVDLLLMEELGDYAAQLPPQVNVRLCCLKNTYGSVAESLLRCIRKKDWLCFRMRIVFLLMKFFGQKTIKLAKKMLTDNKQYDCVIGFRRGICTQIASFACNARRRISWWHHGSINVNTVQYLEEVSACDKIAVVSDACEKALLKVMPELESKLMVIPNMLDVDAVRAKAALFDPFADKTVLHIVSVGGLVPEKHFENAIFAARELKDSGYRFQWHLVGDGVLRTELQTKVKEEKVEDCFILEGSKANPYPYIAHADLFVHPSYVESFGIVIAEALALGVPCVVTKSDGPCEFLYDGINVLLTEQCQDDLTKKTIEMIDNKDLRAAIMKNARCPEEFRPDRVSELIRQIMNG